MGEQRKPLTSFRLKSALVVYNVKSFPIPNADNILDIEWAKIRRFDKGCY